MPFHITRSDPTRFTTTIPTKISYHQDNRVWRIAKDVLSVLFLPVGLYRAWHRVVGLAVVPASMRELLAKVGLGKATDLDTLDSSVKVLLEKNWGLERLTIEADGQQIDVTLLKPPNAKPDRWTLYSTGNAEQYEDILSSAEYCENLFGPGGLNTNVVFFNYPGVGKSGGFPSRSGSVQAYQTLLRWLEEKVKAKELIGFGHSIGGGIQGEAIAGRPKKEGVRYCFIKDRTFSHLSGVAEDLTKKTMPKLGIILGPIVKKIVELSSWNIQTAKASLRTRYPEIVIQQNQYIAVPKEVAWKTAFTVTDDEIINSDKSLALELSQQKDLENTTLLAKKILMVPESHNVPLRSDTRSIHTLCEAVEKSLTESQATKQEVK